MEKGDCIIFTKDDEKFGLILHHSYSEEEETYLGFIILGEIFRKTPSKIEIESSSVLGDKYQNDTADLINSSMRNQQKNDSSVFYTGVKYDVIRIPKYLFENGELTVEFVANVQLNPQFYPLPNFYSRETEYDEICELIKTRILKKDSKTIKWSKIYSSYPLNEILK